MITLVNVSGGNLHLESLGLMLEPGGRWPFEGDRMELLIKAPEIVLYTERGRVFLDEELPVEPVSEEQSEELKGS